MAFNKERLKVLRQQDELSQAALAQALGVSRSTISMYESGQREPDFEMLEAMADYFNVPIASLFTDNKSPVPNEDEAERDEFIRLYQAASPELKEAILALLRAAE